MHSTSTIILALIGLASTVSAAIPPACVLAAVNTQPNPADLVSLCGAHASQVLAQIQQLCGGNVNAAVAAFQNVCQGAGQTVGDLYLGDLHLGDLSLVDPDELHIFLGFLECQLDGSIHGVVVGAKHHIQPDIWHGPELVKQHVGAGFNFNQLDPDRFGHDGERNQHRSPRSDRFRD
ncbi:MAG: hypothetical protein M1826_006507 [Phylliscum demangeonii]|nr:MAG: hypothetical protein M1826_006507 [Phylliscum demangeonii]